MQLSRLLGEPLGDFTQLLPAVSASLKLLSLLLLMNRGQGEAEKAMAPRVRASTAAVNDYPGLPGDLGAA